MRRVTDPVCLWRPVPGESGDPVERERLWVRGSPPNRRRKQGIGRWPSSSGPQDRAAALHSQGREPLEYGRPPRSALAGRRAPRSGATRPAPTGNQETPTDPRRRTGRDYTHTRSVAGGRRCAASTVLRTERLDGLQLGMYPAWSGCRPLTVAACRLAPLGGSYRDRTTLGARKPAAAGLRQTQTRPADLDWEARPGRRRTTRRPGLQGPECPDPINVTCPNKRRPLSVAMPACQA